MVLSVDELARRARATTAQLAEWVELGLLEPTADGFPAEAVERAKLLRMAIDRGLTAKAIAEASKREGDIVGRFVEFGAEWSPSPRVHSVEEVAERVGLDPSFVRRLLVAGAMEDEDADDEDVAAIAAVRTALDAGMPEDALLQLVRVYADALGRVADAEIRLFHFYVHEPLRGAHRDPDELRAATTAATDALLGLVEPTVLFFHRRAWMRALREDVLAHLAEDVSPDGPRGRLPITVLFVDLAGFTPMTEAMGDEAAAQVLDRFSELVRDQALHCDGRVVKQIGDEFMLVFPNATAAVRYALDLAEVVSAEPQFPSLRMGAHTGAALYREADYLGATVNTAARVAGQAERGQLVVTRDVRDAAAIPDIGWERLGERRLKGVAEPVELFVARAACRDERHTDPVCGMHLDLARTELRARWQGRDAFFCSERCRELFEADPGRYTGS